MFSVFLARNSLFRSPKCFLQASSSISQLRSALKGDYGKIRRQFDQNLDPRLEFHKNHVQKLGLYNKERLNFPKSLPQSPDQYLTHHAWNEVLARADSSGRRPIDLVPLWSGLGSLSDEHFKFAAENKLLDELAMILRQIKVALVDEKTKTDDLLSIGLFFCKMRLWNEPRLTNVLSLLLDRMKRLTAKQTLLFCFLWYSNGGLSKQWMGFLVDLETKLVEHRKTWSPDDVTLVISVMNRECIRFKDSDCNDIVATKVKEWLSDKRNWEDLSGSIEEGNRVSTFILLLQNFYFNFTHQQRNLGQGQKLLQQIVASFHEAETWGAKFPFRFREHILMCRKAINVKLDKKFLQKLVREFQKQDVRALDFSTLAEVADCFQAIQFDKKVVWKAIEAEARRRFRADPNIIYSLAERDKSSLFLALVNALVLNGRLPRDLISAVLSPHFYEKIFIVNKLDPNVYSRPFSEVAALLYFLDSCVQVFTPEAVPRIRRDVVGAIKHIWTLLDPSLAGHRQKVAEHIKGVVVALIGDGKAQLGRILPQFDNDDVVIHYRSNGSPMDFELRSSVRMLDYDELKLPSDVKGLVITVEIKEKHRQRPLLALKKKLLEELGYRVEIVMSGQNMKTVNDSNERWLRVKDILKEYNIKLMYGE